MHHSPLHSAGLAGVVLLAGMIASSSPSLAQGSEDRVIDKAQRAVRERVTEREGVRGGDGRARTFSYEAVVA